MAVHVSRRTNVICIYCIVLWNLTRGNVWWNMGVEKDWTTVKCEISCKLGKSGVKINEMLSAMYGEDALKPAIVYKSVKCFQEGCEEVGDDVQSCHPFYLCSEENIVQICTLVLANRQIRTWQLAGLSILSDWLSGLYVQKLKYRVFQNCRRWVY